MDAISFNIKDGYLGAQGPSSTASLVIAFLPPRNVGAVSSTMPCACSSAAMPRVISEYKCFCKLMSASASVVGLRTVARAAGDVARDRLERKESNVMQRDLLEVIKEFCSHRKTMRACSSANRWMTSSSSWCADVRNVAVPQSSQVGTCLCGVWACLYHLQQLECWSAHARSLSSGTGGVPGKCW